METMDTMLTKVTPDAITGAIPTKRQLQIVLLLNPFKEGRLGYQQVAAQLGISVNTVSSTMSEFKKRCPELHSNFQKVRYKQRKTRKKKFNGGCEDCGCKLKVGEQLCFHCWRVRDRKENPINYKKAGMFPANGKTISKLDFGEKNWVGGEYS